MSEEEKKVIEIVKEITFVRGIRKDVEGEEEDLFALEKSLNLIDRLQKENRSLKQENDFLKQLYSGTEEFKSIERKYKI